MPPLSNIQIVYMHGSFVEYCILFHASIYLSCVKHISIMVAPKARIPGRETPSCFYALRKYFDYVWTFPELYKESFGDFDYSHIKRFPGEIPITSDMQMTPPLWQKVKKN